MKTTNLELFLILFLVEYIKEILLPKTNKLLKHLMDLGEFIRWLGCSFYMGWLVGISNRRDWWSTAEPRISEGVPFIINKYISRTRFESILSTLRYIDKRMLINMMVFPHA